MEAQQKKFDDFEKVHTCSNMKPSSCLLNVVLPAQVINVFFIQDMISKEVRIRELTLHAEKLKVEHYTEYEMIREMIEVRNIVWLENYKI